MKVTAVARVIPIGGLTGLSGGGGELSGTDPGTGGYPPSGQVPVATGSNTWAWASNLQTAWANGSNQILGPHINFLSGTGITLSVASNGLTIASAAGGGSALTVKDEGSTLSTAVTSIDFTGAGVTATGTTSVTVAIPGGGSSSDDTIPSGGTLYNGTSTSGWTSFGSPDTFDADTTVPGAFYLDKTSMGTNNLVGVYRAVGSFPKTYTMRVKDGRFHENFHGINILLAESSPGKYWTFGMVRDGGNRYLQRYAWTTASSSGASINYPATVDVVTNPAIWLRFVVNSSTDVEYWMSFNGYIYYQYAAAINPSFTIGNFGFGMYTFAAIRHTIAIDWIHES